MSSKAHIDLQLDPQQKTAIIYNIVELGSYLVEIHYENESHFIASNNENQQFANLVLAKEAATSAGAILLYQALENIHGEVGIHEKRFDYCKLV